MRKIGRHAQGELFYEEAAGEEGGCAGKAAGQKLIRQICPERPARQ